MGIKVNKSFRVCVQGWVMVSVRIRIRIRIRIRVGVMVGVKVRDQNGWS